MRRPLRRALSTLPFLLAGSPVWAAPPDPGAASQPLPTGASITPDFVPGTVLQPLDPKLPGHPGYTVGQAVASAMSPDGARLLALTSGFHRLADSAGKADMAGTTDWVFVYEIDKGALRQSQALPVPNTGQGLAWAPDGRAFYVSGGFDDTVHVFKLKDGSFAEDGPPIALGHKAGLGVAQPPEGAVPPQRQGRESETWPTVAGLAVDPSGRRLIAANFQNDSATLVDLGKRAVAAEIDLRPGKSDPKQAGVPGGEYPLAVAWAGSGRVYVSSQRDREIVTLDLASGRPRVTGRIKIAGQPNALRLNRAGTRLYVAVDNTDSVAVIDTKAGRVIETVAALGPTPIFDGVRGFRGVNPNWVALSPDESTLFVTEGGANAVAVIGLSPAARGAMSPKPRDDDDAKPAGSRVLGLLPTAWYPNAVEAAKDGKGLFILNGKSVAGPNPDACPKSTHEPPGPKPCYAPNQYVLQLQKSSMAAMPLPAGPGLAAATLQVAANMGLDDKAKRDAAEAMLGELRQRIRHVIYVIKENRGYDQVLGDLPAGNGDPKLTLLPAPITPNHHALAARFVTLDAFYDSGEVSGVGWNWSTAARTTDFTEKTVPVSYGGPPSANYEWEGVNRGINVSLDRAHRREADSAIPDDPDLMPGKADVAAPDAAKHGDAQGEAGAGYLWDAALRAGLTLRNYGFYLDIGHYGPKDRNRMLPSHDPFAEHAVQARAAKQSLDPVTDPYFRGFDLAYADFWRWKEWKREFDLNVAHGDLPRLSLVRFPHDHFGSFADSAESDGLGTVEGEMADNDYALGLLVEAVASSRYKDDTLIFVVEDDAQNSADHVDAHRSIAFVAGPYVKQGAVISDHYTTVSMLRTIEAVLGLQPLGLNDALATPMAGVFDLAQKDWRFQASVPAVLRASKLPLPPESQKRADSGCFDMPRRTAQWWEGAMRGQDFSAEDRLDTARFNRALWRGLKGDVPMPLSATGADLSGDRERLLADNKPRCD